MASGPGQVRGTGCTHSTSDETATARSSTSAATRHLIHNPFSTDSRITVDPLDPLVCARQAQVRVGVCRSHSSPRRACRSLPGAGMAPPRLPAWCGPPPAMQPGSPPPRDRLQSGPNHPDRQSPAGPDRQVTSSAPAQSVPVQRNGRLPFTTAKVRMRFSSRLRCAAARERRATSNPASFQRQAQDARRAQE